MDSYLVLLRGINVGGKNVIKMTDLAACFAGMGFTEVRTYIQSGNVIFCGPEASSLELRSRIEAGLSKAFHYESRIALLSHKRMKEIVARAPEGFGSEPDK